MQRLRYSNTGKLDPNSEEYKKHFGAMEERNNAKALKAQRKNFVNPMEVNTAPLQFNSNINYPKHETMSP